jgi:SNF family Na+-dependent transporter
MGGYPDLYNHLFGEGSRMRRVRIIFWTHFAVALYCVACGLLDTTGHFSRWMMPSLVVFYALVLSALALPALALACALQAKAPHRLFLSVTHAVMSVAQLFFGLLPLIS